MPGIIEADFAAELSQRYLSYAMSTILSRSLPDVRDGLKPVHRRLLYAMRELGLNPAGGFKKAARVVGDVIGKFHPHGELAVYDTLVRLAQDFAVRYPLVEGQGNFGNIDGDNPAAMRYTEARLTPVAMALLDGLDQDAVPMRATYDGDGVEPTVLPAAFPHLLANGATGIAVGMATAIPPHNIVELCDALLLLLKKPMASIADLLMHVEGPDFPTGGIIFSDRAALLAAYETGRGSFRVRARWNIETLKNGAYQIIVTELPYQVPKSRLIERIADLLSAKKLPLLADIRDESAEDVRVVLEPKSRGVTAEHLMASLFKQSELESRISLNLNVVDAVGQPRVMNLQEALVAFLDHRDVVLVRQSRFRLAALDRRIEILHGQMIAYLNLDEIIRIIREEDEPKIVMIARFGLSDTQAEAILNMRLRSLRRIDEIAIERELQQAGDERAGLLILLDDAGKRRQAIGKEITALRKIYGPETPLGKRRTTISSDVAIPEAPPEADIEREPITVILSEKGWIRAIRGHGLDPAEIKFKEADGPAFQLKVETTDKLIAFASDGRSYRLDAAKLPRGRGFGEPLRLTIELGPDHEIMALERFAPDHTYLVASSDARGFLVAAQTLLAQTKTGRQIMIADKGATIAAFLPAMFDHIAIIGENRKILIFATAELPVMAKGRGVMLQRYKDGAMSDIMFMDIAKGLRFMAGAKSKQVSDLQPWLGRRGAAGRLAPPGFPRDNKLQKY